jgi:hypothetical protein
VRASCAIFQKPLASRIGTFVVAMATSMMAIRGTAARCVSRPARTRSPHAISNEATNGARASGAGRPIFANRPTPTSAGYALMEDEVVRRRGWLSRQRFLDLIGATNLIPGPNSTEMAIHVGHVRAGWAGLVVAGVSFILPASSS